MAVNFLNDISKYEFSGFPIGFSRNNPIPLDKTEVWLSFEELQTYAREGATAYVGQKLTHVDVENKTATVYVVANEDGDLMPVGSPTEGDEVSISLNDGVLSLKDFGKFFYRYIAAVGEEGQDGYVAAHYERTEVSTEHPWVAGLEPKVTEVDGVLTLGWYEPNPTTLEGLGSQVTATQEAVENLETNVGELEEEVLQVADDVKEIQDVLNDTVDTDGQTVEGLKTRVDNLETDVTNLETALEDVYTKKEVNDLVSSVFHFKGAVATYEELPLLAEVGDVYQVGKKEYAWNGTEWFELGDMVSLDGYATTDYADQAAANAASGVQANVDTLSQTVSDVQEDVAQNATDIGDINTTLNEHQTALDDLATLPEDFEALSEQVGQAEQTDEAGNVTSEATGIYREMQFIEDKLDEITSVGGEPNIIERVFAGSVELTPSNKIVTIPIYSLDKASPGLVPVADTTVDTEQQSNYFLSMDGTWAIPCDIRIGDLNGFETVEAYVDDAIESALTWSAIVEE